MQRLDALTSMRFVAALMVVIFHTSSTAPYFEAVPWPLHSIIDCGYVWVGFFFVLSGFILSYQYLDRVQSGHFSPREFLVARFARIYPAHLVGFLIVAALLPIKTWPWEGGGYPPGGSLATVADVGATLALVHSWVPSFSLTFNFPSWSISTEFFFYLCFPLLVWAIVRWPLRRVIAFGIVVYVCAVAVNLFYCATSPYGWLGNDWPHDEDRNFIKFSPLVRFPEFCIGVVIGRVFAERERLRLTESLGKKWIIAGALAVLFGLSVGEQVPFALMHNVALTIPFVFLVLGLALAPSCLGARLLSRRFLVALGEASYSAYILQAIVLWLFLFPEGLYESTDMSIALPSRLVVIVAIVALSLVSHRYIEQPLRRRIRNLATPTKREEPALVTSAAKS